MVTKAEFYSSQRLEYTIENGHLTCECKVVSMITKEEADVLFIHDTGAYISTLDRELYELLGFDRIMADRHNVELGSYSSMSKGLVFTLPFLFVACYTVTNVQVFVPYAYNLKQNLLAMNVLGLFDQYVSTGSSSIFLKPHNKRVDFRLLAESAFLQVN